MRPRLSVYLVLVLIASCGLLYAVLDAFVMSEFERLERQAARENLSYAIGALGNESASLTTWVRDYAPWDDTYEFVQTGDPSFISTNFAPDTIENLGFDLILFLDRSGAIVWSYVAGAETAADLSLDYLPFLNLDSLEWDASAGVSGLHRMSESAVYQLAAHPILKTDATGPNRGTLIFGRRFDNRQFEKVVSSSIADFHLQPVGSDSASAERVEQIRSEFGGVELGRHKDRMSAITVLRDFNDEPIIILRVGTHRDTVLAGAAAVRNVMLAYVLIAAIGLMIAWLLVAQNGGRKERSAA